MLRTVAKSATEHNTFDNGVFKCIWKDRKLMHKKFCDIPADLSGIARTAAQRLNVPSHNQPQVSGNLFNGPVPPRQGLEDSNIIWL
jgi:hypothetical protein